MRFKNDKQRKAMFANIFSNKNVMFSSSDRWDKEDRIAAMNSGTESILDSYKQGNLRLDDLEEAKALGMVSDLVYESLKRRLTGEFSKRRLYHGTSDVFKTDIDEKGLLPEVETNNPPTWDSDLRRDKSSISLTDEPASAIVYGTLKSDAVQFPNKDIVVYEVDVPKDKLNPDEHYTNHLNYRVGNADESLDVWHVASTKEYPLQPVNKYEFPEYIRNDEDIKEFKTFYFDHADPGLEKVGYLDKKKELTKKIDNKYNFSFDSRKRGGHWYPADFNPPDNFPDVIRNTIADIMNSGQFKREVGEIYYDPMDDRHKAILNGMVNQRLEDNWNSEWGVKPSGRYLKPDVEDALEDLMY